MTTVSTVDDCHVIRYFARALQFALQSLNDKEMYQKLHERFQKFKTHYPACSIY